MEDYRFYIDEENYENESIDSDSGISTESSTISSFSFNDEPTDDVITEIIKEIDSQNPVFIREMIVFSINGILAKDNRLVLSALIFLWKLFKITSSSETCVTEKILGTCPELLSSVKLLIFDESKSKEKHFYVSGIFYYSSKTKIGCDQILEGSIDVLMDMMSFDAMPVIHYTFTCLHNILLSIPKTREVIFQNYDLSSLIKQLPSSNVCLESRLELITVDILSRLATENEFNKKLLFSKRIFHKCLKTLMENKTLKTMIVNSQMIRVLSTNSECKEYLLNNREFIKFLIETCSQITDSHLNRIFWSILLNISDRMLISINEHRQKISDLIYKMVKTIRNFRKTSVSIDTVGVMLCCLSNFSCHQEWVKDILWKKGIQYTIVELLKIEKKSSLPVVSTNTIEACYRCLNHIVHRLLVSSNDFLMKNYKSIIRVLDHLKIKTEDDLHNKLICLSIVESEKIQPSSQIEFYSLVSPIRSWVILIRHILTIELNRNASKKSYSKDYQTMLKSIKHETMNLFNFITNKLLQKHEVSCQEEEEATKDLVNHLNTLINMKFSI